MRYIPYYFICINFITFFCYFLDKYFAKKHMWRIPERVLFLLGLLGGFVGAILGMVCFHHKTRKFFFYLWNLFDSMGCYSLSF